MRPRVPGLVAAVVLLASAAQAHAQSARDEVEALTARAIAEAERGESEAALGYFDAAIARAGGDPPVGLSWNRAACLSALGRAEEAERAFLEVAARADSPLDVLGLINAGLAALDAGHPERAEGYLVRAERRDREGA